MNTDLATVEANAIEQIIAQEPTMFYSKNGRKIICDDLNLANEILFPINQLSYYADGNENNDPVEYAKNFSKCKDLFHHDYGSDMKKELIFDQHCHADSINIQRIFLLNDFALVIAKITTHQDHELIRSYKLIKENDEYQFFKFPVDQILPAESLKTLSKREKIEMFQD
jgi:hypothetical protein